MLNSTPRDEVGERLVFTETDTNSAAGLYVSRAWKLKRLFRSNASMSQQLSADDAYEYLLDRRGHPTVEYLLRRYFSGRLEADEKEVVR